MDVANIPKDLNMSQVRGWGEVLNPPFFSLEAVHG